MVKKLLQNGRKAMDDLDFVPNKNGFEYDDLAAEIEQVKESEKKKTAKVSSSLVLAAATCCDKG